MTLYAVDILFRSFQQPPRIKLGHIKGFFELTLCPLKALDSLRE